MVVGREPVHAAESFVRSPLDQVAPWRFAVIAYPHDRAAIVSLRLGGANLQGIVRLPTLNVSGILCVEVHFPGLQVDAMHIKQFRVTLIHLHQNGVRELPLVRDDVDANFFEGRQIFGLFRRDVGLVKPPVLIPTRILCVQNVLVVKLP